VSVELKGRVLAVDYGKKNIGLAHSDEFRLTVQPLPSLPNIGKKDFLRRVGELAESLEIREAVIGIPIRMDGSRGDAAIAMEKIRRALEGTLKLAVNEMDERLSTVEALEIWREMTPRPQRKYRTVDSLAAALILERFLTASSENSKIKACD
jgi:putative Holliday junction resolvase